MYSGDIEIRYTRTYSIPRRISSSGYERLIANPLTMKQLSKAEMLANIKQEHHLLVETSHALSQSQMVEPAILAAPGPGQSCKHVLAPLTAWEQRMLTIIRAIMTGAPPLEYPSTPKFSEHVFNAN